VVGAVDDTAPPLDDAFALTVGLLSLLQAATVNTSASATNADVTKRERR
jgi:hypothetical protein